jgi:hypothetical protein
MGNVEGITLNFPTLDAEVRFDLLWSVNPDLCALFVRNLPLYTMYSHTLASGEGMYAPLPIVASVPGACELLSEMQPGTVTLSTTNYKSLGIFYGRVTEPLPATHIARVVAGDLPTLQRVGREVWYATYVGTRPVPVNVTAWNGTRADYDSTR